MWVLMNQGYVSIVKHANGDDLFLARARKREHLFAFLPRKMWKQIKETPGNDYHYRITLTRGMLKRIMAEQIDFIDYPNFKNSVSDSELHSFYSDIWNQSFNLWGGYGFGKRNGALSADEERYYGALSFGSNRKRNRRRNT